MQKNPTLITIFSSILCLLFFSCGIVHGTAMYQQENKEENVTQQTKQDDWKLSLSKPKHEFLTKKIPRSRSGQFQTMAQKAANPRPSNQLGLAVGGSKDIHNFRENIKNNYMPLPQDVTYEGLFYDYRFETPKSDTCDSLFCPVYESWVSPDPFSHQNEHFLSIGLQSGMKESDFRREPLNLVIVLDISGSMSSPFNRYYYDRFGNRIKGREQGDKAKQKMEVAKESLLALTKELRPSDRLGIIVFNNQGYIAKPLNLVSKTDMQAIRGHIKKDLYPQGGTNMHSGMQKGTELFREVGLKSRENRIIFMTDAMPNLGVTDKSRLGKLLEKNAAKEVYTSFVGIGVDFNTRLVESLTKIRGANYYSVHNEEEFKEKLAQGLEYMVFPLVFDLGLTLKAKGYSIEKVFGSPEADKSTGEMLHVNTLFPSPSSEKGVKGGIIVVKLNRTGQRKDMELKVSYKDRLGHEHRNSRKIQFTGSSPSTGLRKGVLLSRYAGLLKAWLVHDRILVKERSNTGVKPEKFNLKGLESNGIPVPVVDYPLGKWERQSVPLTVSSEYKKIFQVFASYFVKKADNLNDPALQKEVKILKSLSRFNRQEKNSGKRDDWKLEK